MARWTLAIMSLLAVGMGLVLAGDTKRTASQENDCFCEIYFVNQVDTSYVMLSISNTLEAGETCLTGSCVRYLEDEYDSASLGEEDNEFKLGKKLCGLANTFISSNNPRIMKMRETDSDTGSEDLGKLCCCQKTTGGKTEYVYNRECAAEQGYGDPSCGTGV